jgi:T4-like virus tail tube protein gp19
MPNYYKNQANREYGAAGTASFNPGSNLPIISTQTDSVRSYQFEVQIEGLPNQTVQRTLTLAAKQVQAISFGVEKIDVHRVNDLVRYPGKITHEAVKITFDNLYAQNTSQALWEWMKTVYNPMTGNSSYNPRLGSPSSRLFKAKKMTIYELDHLKTPIGAIQIYGVYPEKVEFKEKNYSTGDFDTLSVDFQYDYIDYFRGTQSPSRN